MDVTVSAKLYQLCHSCFRFFWALFFVLFCLFWQPLTTSAALIAAEQTLVSDFEITELDRYNKFGQFYSVPPTAYEAGTFFIDEYVGPRDKGWRIVFLDDHGRRTHAVGFGQDAPDETWPLPDLTSTTPL